MSISWTDINGMVGNFFLLGFESILTGAVVGLSSALLLKHVDLNYDPIKESIIILSLAYFSYLAAEQFAFSGIISMFSCGLFMAHYTFWNVGKKTQKGVEMTINTISSMSQSFLYIYLGLSAFSVEA